MRETASKLTPGIGTFWSVLEVRWTIFFRQAARAVCAVVHHHFIIIYVSSVCPSRFMSKTIQDRAIVTMEYEQETVPKLSNGTIFNDLERP